MGLFGRKKKDQEDAVPTNAQEAQSFPPPTTGHGGGEERRGDSEPAAGHREIDAYWAQIGTVDPDVITYLINPMFQGAPSWPNTRQAYRVVRTPNTVIIASDGLADASADSPGPGFGCEVYIESPALVGADFEALRGSWMFAAIENFAQNVAAMQGISGHLRQYGVASMELPLEGTDIPPALLTERGTAGALIGMPVDGRAPQVTTSAGPVDIVPLTIIGADELSVVLEQGQAGRDSLVSSRQQDGRGHVTVV